MKKKYVYFFKKGNKKKRDLLGEIGFNKCELTKKKYPVPSGFVVINNSDDNFKKEYNESIDKAISKIEKKTKKKFGYSDKPLLLTVKNGNINDNNEIVVGINDEIIRPFSNKKYIYDSYKKLITVFASKLDNYKKEEFDKILDNYEDRLSDDDYKTIISDYKNIYTKLLNSDFIEDAKEQLHKAIDIFLESGATSVIVEEAIYGEDIIRGNIYSRNPSTGKKELYGEYRKNNELKSLLELKEESIRLYEELIKYVKKLELQYKDMQNVEFEVVNNKLYILNSISGERTIDAAIKIALDFYREKITKKEESILMVDNGLIKNLYKETFAQDPKEKDSITEGISIVPCNITGKVYFDANNIEEKGILIKENITLDDINSIDKIKGIISINDGKTSYISEISRRNGICLICDPNFEISEKRNSIKLSDCSTIKEGEYISIDGNTGLIYKGKFETKKSNLSDDTKLFFKYADEFKKTNIKCEIDDIEEIKDALETGADGIGLFKTEKILSEKKCLLAIRKLLLSNEKEIGLNALDKALPYLIFDFKQLFESLDGKTVSIRLFNSEINSILPKEESEIKELAKSLEVTEKKLIERIKKLIESNSFIGNRGVRLAIFHEELIKFQTKAIIEAAISVREDGVSVIPEIMVPFVTDPYELDYVKKIIEFTASSVMKEKNVNINYSVGNTIETPRAAMLSREISYVSDFYSIDTDVLTEMIFGLDKENFELLDDYNKKNIFDFNPFETLDTSVVGRLIKLAVFKAKDNKKIDIGISGSQVSKEKSLAFISDIGIDYVTVSPNNVLETRLSIAKVEIKKKRKK